MAVNPSTGIALVSNEKGDRPSLINLTTQSVTGTINVLDKPGALVVDVPGNRAVVVHEKSDTLSLIDLAANSVIATVATGDSPRGVAVSAAGSWAVVVNKDNDSLQVIDLSSLNVTGQLVTGRNPQGVAIGVGDLAIVANEKDDLLSYLDLGKCFAYQHHCCGAGLSWCRSTQKLEPDYRCQQKRRHYFFAPAARWHRDRYLCRWWQDAKVLS